MANTCITNGVYISGLSATGVVVGTVGFTIIQ
jgi:hypothetical protein